MSIATTTTKSTPSRTKKDSLPAPRPEIWGSLLRQTREAQARSRRQTLQSRSLILCGGAPEDQRQFVERYVARPPPIQPPRRNEQRVQKRRGEVRLCNRFALGYGFVTLFAPGTVGVGGAGGGLGGLGFGGESEEVARVEVHTLPSAEVEYESILRRLLKRKKDGEATGEGQNTPTAEPDDEDEEGEDKGRRAAICLLLSWREPWKFLHQLQRWLVLLSRALQPPRANSHISSTTPDPLGILQKHQLNLTLVLQHTEAQDDLLRDAYTEDTFDYISQVLRTCVLPLASAMLYMPSDPSPQQPATPLTEVQKVLYASLDLDLAALQTKISAGSNAAARAEVTVAPRHNVVDRMAVLVPRGWDSMGKIRLLAETFSPEGVLEAWKADLSTPVFAEANTQTERGTTPDQAPREEEAEPPTTATNNDDEEETELHANGGAEIYTSHPTTNTNMPSPLPPGTPTSTPATPAPPLSPSKLRPSILRTYESQTPNPNAHRLAAASARLQEAEVSTKPHQEFLAEMRAQLQIYEAEDAAKAARQTAAGEYGGTGRPLALFSSSRANSTMSPASGDGGASGEALSKLGDINFNVGGIRYDSFEAEAAIERLRRPVGASSSPSGGGEVVTPSVSRTRREAGSETPGSGREVPTERLEEYFASLMRNGGGGG